MKPQGIAVLGATGSIGINTLDVLARHPDHYRVEVLTGNRQVARMLAQCLQHKPRVVVMADETAAGDLRRALAEQALSHIQVWHGAEALVEAVRLAEVETVMAAIVGVAGLPSAMAAAQAGKRVLLANKEALVVAGRLFMQAVAAAGATLLPVDSEHSAIFQSLPADWCGDLDAAGVDKIILTASGGPFRTRAAGTFDDITPQDACNHPNWDMGRKISVDSATLMNKGLEVIEAHWLFNAPADRIEVVVHPQSVIHSMVQYRDGSVIAQLGSPDMRTPIACALAWPERIVAGVPPLDLCSLSALTFEAPDLARFPSLGLAFAALSAGGDAPAVLNAANEAAVAAFLAGKIRFTDISALVDAALSRMDLSASDSLDGLLAKDRATRDYLSTRIGV
ncbi:1-deoxy-D-xylulose-5-phosphate reductoisomerase [Paludibacterium purpuratum]|uniref:1-deoxy-D-xylulose 5-phosphate reductoisomerase n=1 Tax=Paludibacterium purpuratum TaxID=1144873 RepID=A0A4R7AZH8_9NEIS|nr:1-deoxy-D-xylulose-5-phosphate reductoisomerase [Paludibacterium purpuratum]TDR73841.1 1-deoxy-D-xylulose 5-phosphate reductoisomerase [Paludibacterium purpuratum]